MASPVFFVFAALFLGAACAQDVFVGGYSDIAVGANETALLTNALATDARYDASVKTRVCFTAITTLQQQIVAGINYKYTVTACPVSSAQQGQGKCPSAVLASCRPTGYVVTVFEQSWTNTTQVTSIEAVSANSTGTNSTKSPSENGPSPPPSPSPAPTSGAAVVAASSVAIAAIACLGALM